MFSHQAAVRSTRIRFGTTLAQRSPFHRTLFRMALASLRQIPSEAIRTINGRRLTATPQANRLQAKPLPHGWRWEYQLSIIPNQVPVTRVVDQIPTQILDPQPLA